MSDLEAIITIVGLTAITVITRSFFFISKHEWVLPGWVRRGLRYAPLAALAAVVVPEIVMTTQGQLIDTWRDARLFAALAGTLYFLWRQSILGTIVVGMAVMVPLKVGLGW
ncbi:MAG: putative rane protein [Rhizobacter sp.]|jgi:branched-subunit amino acid transport protein|nr:putative rane protein [Rhizobacter sp.]